jgi:YebC/PmpR family DNA-binding regulatory protein
MAGHSKFKNIQFRKGAQDKKRAKQFGKIGREIQIASKLGGPDPEKNPRLRLAMNNARSVNMPKDNIERAINKNNTDTADYSEIRYEGYGPYGTAFIIEALTDNKNRTATEIRTIFSRNGGNLGETGSVSYNFDKVGEVVIKASLNDETIEELIEVGVEDYVLDGGETYLYCKLEDLFTVEKFVQDKKLEVEGAKLIWKPNMNVEITSREDLEKLLKLSDDLEDNDDVQNCFSNLAFDSKLIGESDA